MIRVGRWLKLQNVLWLELILVLQRRIHPDGKVVFSSLQRYGFARLPRSFPSEMLCWLCHQRGNSVAFLIQQLLLRMDLSIAKMLHQNKNPIILLKPIHSKETKWYLISMIWFDMIVFLKMISIKVFCIWSWILTREWTFRHNSTIKAMKLKTFWMKQNVSRANAVKWIKTHQSKTSKNTNKNNLNESQCAVSEFHPADGVYENCGFQREDEELKMQFLQHDGLHFELEVHLLPCKHRR